MVQLIIRIFIFQKNILFSIIIYFKIPIFMKIVKRKILEKTPNIAHYIIFSYILLLFQLTL